MYNTSQHLKIMLLKDCRIIINFDFNADNFISCLIENLLNHRINPDDFIFFPVKEYEDKIESMIENDVKNILNNYNITIESIMKRMIKNNCKCLTTFESYGVFKLKDYFICHNKNNMDERVNYDIYLKNYPMKFSTIYTILEDEFTERFHVPKSVILKSGMLDEIHKLDEYILSIKNVVKNDVTEKINEIYHSHNQSQIDTVIAIFNNSNLVKTNGVNISIETTESYDINVI